MKNNNLESKIRKYEGLRTVNPEWVRVYCIHVFTYIVTATYPKILCNLNVFIMDINDNSAGGVMVVVDWHSPPSSHHVCHKEMLTPSFVFKVLLVKGNEVLFPNHVSRGWKDTQYYILFYSFLTYNFCFEIPVLPWLPVPGILSCSQDVASTFRNIFCLGRSHIYLTRSHA